MARLKRDPLIAAMIAKLPSEGEAFPVDEQKAWLELMAMAFRAAYGGSVSDLVIQSTPDNKTAVNAPQMPVPSIPFYIDLDGTAKRKGGIPIKPGEVKGDLVDLRGIDGDVSAIKWADGSSGLNGADLTIIAG